MNKTSLFTATAFAVVVGLGSYTAITKAEAQGAPTPPSPMADGMPPMHHEGMMHEGMGMEGGW